MFAMGFSAPNPRDHLQLLAYLTSLNLIPRMPSDDTASMRAPASTSRQTNGPGPKRRKAHHSAIYLDKCMILL